MGIRCGGHFDLTGLLEGGVIWNDFLKDSFNLAEEDFFIHLVEAFALSNKGSQRFRRQESRIKPGPS